MLRVGISPEFNWDSLYSNNTGQSQGGVQDAVESTAASSESEQNTAQSFEDTQARMIGQWVSSLQNQARTPAQQYAANTGKDPELGSSWGLA